MMVYHKNNQWNISTEKIRYIQDGIESENIVGQEGKQWWLEFEAKWDDMKIIEFIDIEVTEKQLDRLEEVNQLSIGDGYGGVVGDYVIDNKFPDSPNHPLKDLQNKKAREEQEPYIMDLDFRMSMVELGM